MKIILLSVVVTCCYTLATADDWKDYKTKFNKIYMDPAEDEMRKELFLKNKHYIEEHNKKYEAGIVSFSVKLNQFSDWTDEEMKRLFGIKRPNAE